MVDVYAYMGVWVCLWVLCVYVVNGWRAATDVIIRNAVLPLNQGLSLA